MVFPINDLERVDPLVPGVGMGIQRVEPLFPPGNKMLVSCVVLKHFHGIPLVRLLPPVTIVRAGRLRVNRCFPFAFTQPVD